MKKHLIALAVASAISAPAIAQNVSISGLLETGYISRDVRAIGSTTTTTSQSGIIANQVATNNITFSGTEDLGGGLKAAFMIQEEFNAWDGSTETSASAQKYSQTKISLMGGFGTVSVGQFNAVTRDIGGVYRFFGDIGRLVAGVNDAANQSNNIEYISPSFNGLTLSASTAGAGKTVVTNADTNTKPQGTTTFGAQYAAGPIKAAAAQSTYNYAAAAAGLDRTKVITRTYGGSYDLGAVRVGAVMVDQEHTVAAAATSAKRDALGLHVAAPVSAALLAGFSYTNYSLTPAAGGAKPEADVVTLAARYDLSKRTAIYASYQSIKNNGTADATGSHTAAGINATVSGTRGMGVVETTGVTASGYGVTIAHTF